MGKACARACDGKLPKPTEAQPAQQQQQQPAQQQQQQAQQQRQQAQQQRRAASEPQAARQRVPVDWSLPELPPDLATAQRESDEAPPRAAGARCVDERPDCASLARANLSACGEAAFMLQRCAATCRTCAYQKLIGTLTDCADSHEQCATWASAGECDANPRFMLSSCSAACGRCDSKGKACARRNKEPAVHAPGGLRSNFASIAAGWAEYSPTLLSSEPYVVQFEGLISPAEAERMVELAGEKLERSLAGDQLSPVRTSTQYWCGDEDGCTRDPTIDAITKRMTRIAGVPEENAEYFQILKYEPGQFYRTHHDQQSAHWTPQGVRVYTFFVYLSDVEAGGGTRFTDLGITVTPKLGRAVLWPSVLDSDLLTGEPKTHHEAVTVEAGVKYAANLWIHLYDFKSPSRAGECPFLGQNTHNGR